MTVETLAAGRRRRSARSALSGRGRTARRRVSRWIVVGLGLYGAAGLLGLVTLLVPSLKHRLTDQDLSQTFLPPLSDGHLLGTDSLGRDFAWRLVAGLGVSIAVGVGVALVSVFLGLVVGILGGYFGRTAAFATGVAVDVTWAFPAVLLAVVLAGWLGPGLTAVVLALALTGWASFAKIVHGEVMSLRERDFIAAARVLGISRVSIGVTHLLRNLIPVTMVIAVFFISTAIVAEAGLSFLGLGAQAPTPSIGIILAEGRDYLSLSWWPVMLAGGALTGLVLLTNALADELRDLLDPRDRSGR